MPTAVATSASAMPAITACDATCPAEVAPWPGAACPSSSKAWMTPTTVPNRPTNGALLPTVARNASPRSSRPRSSAAALCIAFSAASVPRSASRSPASATRAATAGLASSILARAREVAGARAARRARAPAPPGCRPRCAGRASARPPAPGWTPTARPGTRAPSPAPEASSTSLTDSIALMALLSRLRLAATDSGGPRSRARPS